MSGLFSKIFPISTPLPRPPVPDGLTRICVSGFGISHHTGRARAIASAIAEQYPEKYETWYYFDTRGFRPSFLDSIKGELSESGSSSSCDSTGSTSTDDFSKEVKTILTAHSSSPFCWLEQTTTDTTTTKEQKAYTPLGGRDALCEWTMTNFADGEDEKTKNAAILSLCHSEPTRSWKEIKFDATTPGTAKTQLYNI